MPMRTSFVVLVLHIYNMLEINSHSPSQIKDTNNSVSHLDPKSFRFSSSTKESIHAPIAVVLRGLGDFSDYEEEFLRNELVPLLRSRSAVPPAVGNSILVDFILPNTQCLCHSFLLKKAENLSIPGPSRKVNS